MTIACMTGIPAAVWIEDSFAMATAVQVLEKLAKQRQG